MTCLMMLCTVSCLAGCGIKRQTIVVSTCKELAPIRPSRQDVLTKGTEQQIVSNNTSLYRMKGLPLPKKKPKPSH